MGQSLGHALMLGWCVVTAVLFRVLGPRRATLIAVIGGNLLIPCLVFDIVSPTRVQFTQAVAIGLAVALGIVFGDPRALARIRIDWLDAPMLAYAAYPLCGLITNGPAGAWDVVDMLLQRGLGALVPYAAARRYLGDPSGARDVAVAIVLATLPFVPIVGYEEVVGPRWYLGRLLYGMDPSASMAERLGGWRPQAFFLNGLTFATWMALAAVVASWLWLWRSWRPRWGPAWGPALVLVLASVSCRGVYAYITLGLGLAAAAASRLLRTRWAIALVLLIAPLYMGLRLTGEWDARVLLRMAEPTGRARTVEFRLQAEDAIIARVLARHPILGFGLQIWHFESIHETLGPWPDGQWLITVWSGGLAGLTLQLAALSLVPAGLALALTRLPARGGLAGPGAAIAGLALFTALCLEDTLHNNAIFTPLSLVAGTLVGAVILRRRGPVATEPPPRAERGPTRVASPPRPPVETTLIPYVTATACALYVFGHAPVAGHEIFKLVGGLGAGLLFAAAGGVGAWAGGLIPLPRLAVFAGLFAILGVSFNLALHPNSRPVATADILQGLALAGLAMACWRRWSGPRVGFDAIVVALPLLAHFLLPAALPAFPGSQYLYTDPAGERSLFPLFPWLTMAALGAQAAGETAAVNGAFAALFAASSALAWWANPGAGGPVKFPMDLPYALLSCAAIEAAFALAHGLRRLAAPARAARWLGRNWLIFFYVHFAVVFAVGRLGIVPPAAVWTLLAGGSVGATWLVAKSTAPLAPGFRSSAAWSVLLALVVVAAVGPGLSPAAVLALAGPAGLIFAAHHGTLAYLVVNHPSSQHRPEAPGAVAPGLGRGLTRLAAILALLAVPEIVGSVERAGPARPARPDAPAGAPSPKAPPAALPEGRGPRGRADEPDSPDGRSASATSGVAPSDPRLRP